MRNRMLLAEQLVGESRDRAMRRMAVRERVVVVTSGALFVAAALVIAILVPSERPSDHLLIAGLVVGYAIISRLQFEVGNLFLVPEQLFLVPTLLLAPLPYVPLLVAAAAALGMAPDILRGSLGRDRWIGAFSDSWFVLGPVLLLAALAPGQADSAHVLVYALAFASQAAVDFAWSLIRNVALDHTPAREVVRSWADTTLIDGMLFPLALVVALAAAEEPLALVCVAPLMWLMQKFSEDRRERYGATLELNRAYRGTVMLLSDVVEFDDHYTADHSRSVVELAQTVGDAMGIDHNGRQELEFAALLHDVGKIAIPKEILNKPASLTDDE